MPAPCDFHAQGFDEVSDEVAGVARIVVRQHADAHARSIGAKGSLEPFLYLSDVARPARARSHPTDSRGRGLRAPGPPAPKSVELARRPRMAVAPRTPDRLGSVSVDRL